MTTGLAQDPSPRPIAVPRLWTIFVLGWLLVLGASAVLLVRSDRAAERVVPSLSVMAMLGAMYLWFALRGSLGASDLTVGAPAPREARRRYILLGSMAVVVLLLVAMNPDGGMWWQMMYPAICAGLALPPAAAAGAIAVMLPLAFASAWIAVGKIEIMLLILVAIGGGAVAVRQLTVAIAQLQAARTQLARRAADEERLRIARDLHDLLGHSLSLIVLKSELARRRLPGDPRLAASELCDIEHSARDALRQVRGTVAGYRQPTLHGELEAARELLVASGIEATISDSSGSLPHALDGLMAWAVREGVTNVIRHSRAAHCVVEVCRDDSVVVVSVTDDGAGAGSAPGPTGNGLAGLAERAAALGGRVSIDRMPERGYCLTMTAPLTHHAGVGA